MSFRDLFVEAKKDFPEPAYLLIAADRFLLSEAIDLLKQKVPADQRDFLLHVFDLLSADTERPAFSQVADVLNTVPFFGGRKYVIVDNVQKMLKRDMTALAGYLESPAGHSVLVLLYTGTAKTIKKELQTTMGNVRRISLDIREQDIPGWLMEKARSRGITLTKETAQYLLGVIGPDLGMLSSELDKLALFGANKISTSDIADVIEGKRSFTAFGLIDAIRSGDAAGAFRIYRALRETEEPYSILGALNWHYSRQLGESGRTGDPHALEIFTLLHEADVGVKTGGSYQMELLLGKLLERGERGSTNNKKAPVR